MNIVEAYKTAQIGDKVCLSSKAEIKKTDAAKLRHIITKTFNDEMMLSDNWYIQKVPKKWAGEMYLREPYDRASANIIANYLGTCSRTSGAQFSYELLEHWRGKNFKLTIEEV